jgi:hypothetical protein
MDAGLYPARTLDEAHWQSWCREQYRFVANRRVVIVVGRLLNEDRHPAASAAPPAFRGDGDHGCRAPEHVGFVVALK